MLYEIGKDRIVPENSSGGKRNYHRLVLLSLLSEIRAFIVSTVPRIGSVSTTDLLPYNLFLARAVSSPK